MDFGVYVHVPFCASRCDYCAFATWTDKAHLARAYVEACVRDVGRRYAEGGHPPASSVFFGGGTPSLLDPDLLARVLDAVPRRPDAEVTVECNPDSVDLAKLRTYRRHGVSRISLGVQSMADHVLASLGRTHVPTNVARAVEWIGDAGFPTFNLDLIYGAAGESVDDWRRTLDAVLALDPPHVSAYALTVEPGTLLHRRVDAARPDDDDQATKYALADDLFTAAGRPWYEISNWARPGHECRHNLLYWRGGDYLGIGCAAHGYTDGRRWWTVRTPERYVAAIGAGASPEAGSETLDAPERAAERLMLRLRTRHGVRREDVEAGDAAPLVDQGLLRPHADRLVLTPAGRLVASEVTLRLRPARPEDAVSTR